MHIITFLQDLAVIMMVAGIVTVIFHQFKQPVVLGYILSGVILGGHTPPFSFIHDENIVKTLAELGVIFLMFSLGLEFSIRKLFRVGMVALIAAFAEIILMTLIGYEMGRFFGWKSMDSLFLGAMLAISSTTIIIKALHELGMKRDHSTHLIFGILIIEDILAIGILAILSSVALSGSLDINNLVTTLGKLFVFLIASSVIGIFLVPRLLAYIAHFHSREMLLVSVLGLCFGFSLLVIKLGYSIALGAFLIGSMMAESREIKLIEKLVEPLTNMFSAIFFVSIGLLVDPNVIRLYMIPIVIITIALVIGKILVCSLSVFLAGRDARMSVRVGMSLAQIGEFSFIIASLGISLNVMSPYLYPIIVAVSAITTFLTPYLIKLADPLTTFLAKIMPQKILQISDSYTIWLKQIHPENEQMVVKQAIKNGLLQTFINLILIIGIFIVGSYLARSLELGAFLTEDANVKNTILWGGSLIISLPFLIAIYKNLKGLSMILTGVTFQSHQGKNNIWLRLIIAEIISVVSVLSIILMIIALSTSILPPIEWLIFALVIVILLAILLWPWFIKLHSFLQVAFMETFKRKDKKDKS